MDNNGQIDITVERKDDDGIVNLELSDSMEEVFGLLMAACEYLLHFTASRSQAGYDKALEILTKGAKTYDDLTGAGSA